MAKYIRYIAIILFASPVLIYTFNMLIAYWFFRDMDLEIVTSSAVVLIVLGGIYIFLTLGWNGAFALSWVLISRSSFKNYHKALFIIVAAVLLAVSQSVWFYMSLHQRVQQNIWQSISHGAVACVVYMTLGLVLLRYTRDH